MLFSENKMFTVIASFLKAVWPLGLNEKGSCRWSWEIIKAFCTCTAGLLGSCDYVAGLLFRIEAVVLIEVTHPTCTSIVESQDQFKKLPPQTATCSSKFLEADNSDKIKSKLEHQTSLTMSQSQAEKLKDKKNMHQELLERILNAVPKSCFVELMTGKKNRDTSLEISAPTVLDFAESFIDSWPRTWCCWPYRNLCKVFAYYWWTS